MVQVKGLGSKSWRGKLPLNQVAVKIAKTLEECYDGGVSRRVEKWVEGKAKEKEKRVPSAEREG